MIYRLKWL